MFKAIGYKTKTLYMRGRTKADVLRKLAAPEAYPTISYLTGPIARSGKDERKREPIYPEPIEIIEVRKGRPKHERWS